MINEMIITEFAAFGGSDAYTSSTKGVISRPGDEHIGYRVDIGHNDRVFFKIPHANLVNGNGASGTVSKSLLFITPVHVMTYNHTSMPVGDLFKVRKVESALDLSTCSATAAMSATLSGDYATVAIAAQWLAGQTGYDGSTQAKSIDPWELDITTVYNDAITNNIDLFICLECVASSTAVMVELFGTEINEFVPRVEVATHSTVSVAINDIDSGKPSLSITNFSPGTVSSFRWGYDLNYEGKWMNYPRFAMLETSSRVYVEVIVDYSGVTNTFKKTFKTPKVFKPFLPNTSSNQLPAAVLATRNPCYIEPGTSEDFYAFLTKISTGWVFYKSNTGFGSPPFQYFGRFSTVNPSADLPPIVADDAGHPYYDWALRMIFFLTCSYNSLTGKYDIVMRELMFGLASSNASSNASVWFYDDASQGWSLRTSSVIYSATAQPDMKLSSVTRTYTLRNTMSIEPHASLLASFVADGKVFTYSKSDRVLDYWANSYTLALSYDFTTPWVKEIENTTSIDSELTFLHTLTTNRAHRTILVGKHSTGTCLLATRQDTEQIWNHNTSLWDRCVRDNSGTPVVIGNSDTAPSDTPTNRWTIVTPSNFKGAYITQQSITNMNGHMPDEQTCYVGLINTNSVTFYTPALNAATPSGLLYNPAWDTAWYDGHIIEKFPTVSSKYTHCIHGGCVGINWSGTELNTERISDFLSVSGTSVKTVTAGSELYTVTENAPEGISIPVVIGSSGVYKVIDMYANMNAGMIDTPTFDMMREQSTGTILEANFDTSFSKNSKCPGLKQLPGNNHFALSYDFDPGSYSNGVMNSGGHIYFKVKGVQGQRLKFSVYQSSIGAGVWIDGVFRPYTSDYSGSPELIGGMEWPVCKYDTWWYTYDAPSTPNRKWKRIWDTDLLLDGETNGGTQVLVTPILTGKDVWIAHDPVFDIDTFKGTFNEWYIRSQNVSDSAYGLLNYTNAHGELLYGGTNSLTKDNILSQQGQDPYQYWTTGSGHPTNQKRNLTTWEDEYTKKPGTVVGREGDNYLGFVIEDLTVSKTNKKLVIIGAADDAQEFTGGTFLKTFVDELLSGSDISLSALQSYAFLVIPFFSQAAVRDGFTRYNRDHARQNGTNAITFDGPTGWGGRSIVGGQVIKTFITNWLAERTAAGGAAGTGIYAAMSCHADTHNDPERAGVGQWPFVTPYIMTTFNTTTFKNGLMTGVEKEFFSTSGNVGTGAYWNTYSEISTTITSNGGKPILIELPWRAAAQKGGYWWDQHSLRQMARGVLAGFGLTLGSNGPDIPALPYPKVLFFTLPANHLGGSDIPVIELQAIDYGNVEYLITDSSTPPTSGDPGWSENLLYAVAPTSGTITFYPWAKGSNGSVSSVFASPQSVNVTIDTAPPTTTPNPSGGTFFANSKTITLTTNESSTIYYTLDGSTPNINSLVYTGPITITENTVLKFFAIDLANNSEVVKTEIYTLNLSPLYTLTGVLAEIRRVDGSVATILKLV